MDSQQLLSQYLITRVTTEKLCQPLLIEDYVIQSIPDVSPPKWHLAHTTWFFETFLLKTYSASYIEFDPLYQYLFNSYYQRLGEPYPRAKRGLLSRPSVQEVYDYRRYVDEQVSDLVGLYPEHNNLLSILELGIHHEQQHQELLLMDIKHNYSLIPDFSPYLTGNKSFNDHELTTLTFVAFDGGETEVGHKCCGFSFDNEKPCHLQQLQPYVLANRLVTNGEFANFIADGGYENPQWWLADGWDYISKKKWQAPLYWWKQDNDWLVYTLQGLSEMDPRQPVVHVSFYEAYAYASYVNKRLPTEAEWENVANRFDKVVGNFLEDRLYHPQSLKSKAEGIEQLFGDVWEWTASPYTAYPGFKAEKNALGEYNGKFMSSQMVLRGGSCITPKAHIRPSYRNFFHAEKRWQFSGIRLADDLKG